MRHIKGAGEVLRTEIADMLSPDFLVIGSDDDRATQKVLDVYRRLYPVLPPAAVIAPVNAELAKLAINTFVTTKISFANMLYQLHERVAGGDVDQVTTAVGLDQRIGSKYLRGGLGFGVVEPRACTFVVGSGQHGPDQCGDWLAVLVLDGDEQVGPRVNVAALPGSVRRTLAIAAVRPRWVSMMTS